MDSPKVRKQKTKKDLDTARAIEERIFCHSLKLRGYPTHEIAASATRHFQRRFTMVGVSRLLEEELLQREELAEHLVSRMRYVEGEKLDALQRIVEDMLSPTYLDAEGAVKRRNESIRLGAVASYLRIIETRSKMFGLNAIEHVEATVTVVTPQDPAVLALIAEAERATSERPPR